MKPIVKPENVGRYTDAIQKGYGKTRTLSIHDTWAKANAAAQREADAWVVEGGPATRPGQPFAVVTLKTRERAS